MDECVKKMWYIFHIYIYIYHNGILTSYKKERNAAVWDNMNGLWGHCAKWNKPDKDKYCRMSPICGTWKKTPKLRETKNRLKTATGGWWGKWVKVVNRNKLPVHKINMLWACNAQHGDNS